MVKIVLDNIDNVGDLVKALQSLPKDAGISPFGSANCVLAYDEEEGLAYLDERSFVEEMDNFEESSPDMEVVDLWMDKFKNNHPDPTEEEIDEEIKEAEGTINNELIWINGASIMKDHVQMHRDNIETLKEYISALKELKEISGEKER